MDDAARVSGHGNARFGIALAAIVTVVVGCLGGIEAAYIHHLDQSMREMTLAAASGVSRWREQHFDEVTQVAEDPVVRELTAALSSTTPRTPASLLAADAQAALRRHLASTIRRHGYRGLFVIATDGTNLASMRDANVGEPTLLAAQPQLLARVWAGHTAMSRPQRTDVPLGIGEREDAPTMFVAAPIRDSAGAVLAALALRIEPGAILTSWIDVARFGDTGETYIVDDEGRLVTESRFEHELVGRGRLAAGQSSVFHTRLVRPSRPTEMTLAVRELLAGHGGASTSGYEGYTGHEVIGAWYFDPELRLGVVTEQHAAEAFSELDTLQSIMAISLLLVAACGGWLAYAMRRSAEGARTWALDLLKAQAMEQAATRRAEASALSLREAQRLSRIGSGTCDLVDGHIEWSEEAQDVLGPDLPATVEGFPALVDRFAGEDCARVEAMLERARARPCSARLEASLVSGDGSLTRVEMLLLSVRGEGEGEGETEKEREAPVRMILTAQDVTERYRMRSTMDELRTRMHQGARLEAIGRLAGGIAHDFNNLLMVIVACSDQLIRECAGGPAHQDATHVFDAAMRASELTKQMLELTRGSELGPSACDVNATVRDLSRMLERVLGENVDLELSLASDLGLARARSSDVDQIVMNLVINARDAMPSGGTIAIETKRVRFEADENLEDSETSEIEDWVRLTVRDDGTGMTPSVAANAFSPFFTTKPEGEGTGLGLATIAEILERLNGHVDVRSDPGRGTIVEVYFRPARHVAGAARVERVGAVAVGRYRILLVEDDVSIRSMLERVLRVHGYRVVTANDAGEARAAVARVAEQGEQFDVLITDVGLKGETGPELAAGLWESRPTLPVVFISGYANGQVLPDLSTGQLPAEFLAKPFTAAALLSAIRRRLGHPDRVDARKESDADEAGCYG